MAAYRDRKIELAVAASLFGIFLFLLLGALERVEQEGEEAAVQAEAAALRVELLDRLSHREAFGGPLPDSDNPVAWAGRAPPAYAGEFDEAPAARGVWYFDRRAGVLAYRFRQGGEARFRLARLAAARDSRGALGGVGLLRLENGQ